MLKACDISTIVISVRGVIVKKIRNFGTHHTTMSIVMPCQFSEFYFSKSCPEYHISRFGCDQYQNIVRIVVLFKKLTILQKIL